MGSVTRQSMQDFSSAPSSTSRRKKPKATRGSIAGKKKDFLRVKCPTKPLGFLAASAVERDPARPEAYRSTVGAAASPAPKDKAV